MLTSRFSSQDLYGRLELRRAPLRRLSRFGAEAPPVLVAPLASRLGRCIRGGVSWAAPRWPGGPRHRTIAPFMHTRGARPRGDGGAPWACDGGVDFDERAASVYVRGGRACRDRGGGRLALFRLGALAVPGRRLHGGCPVSHAAAAASGSVLGRAGGAARCVDNLRSLAGGHVAWHARPTDRPLFLL